MFSKASTGHVASQGDEGFIAFWAMLGTKETTIKDKNARSVLGSVKRLRSCRGLWSPAFALPDSRRALSCHVKPHRGILDGVLQQGR